MLDLYKQKDVKVCKAPCEPRKPFEAGVGRVKHFASTRGHPMQATALCDTPVSHPHPVFHPYLPFLPRASTARCKDL